MIVYRTMNKDDIPSLMKLYSQMSGASSDFAVIDCQKIDEVWNNTKNSDIVYFVADNSGEIISTCYICIIPNITHNGRPIGYIENVITDERFRRQGIATKVLQMAIDYGKSKDCHKIVLLSGQTRTDAHLFYKSIGFDGDRKHGFVIS